MTPQARRIGVFATALIVLSAMLAITTYASLDRSLLDVRPELTRDPWFLATLCDAYCGFLIFYVWVAYKETTVAGRIVWFVLIMALGNIATAIYLMRELWRTRRSQDVASFLLRRESTAP